MVLTAKTFCPGHLPGLGGVLSTPAGCADPKGAGAPEQLAVRYLKLMVVHNLGGRELKMHHHFATGMPEITSFTVAFLVEGRCLMYTHLYLDLDQSLSSSEMQKIECLVNKDEDVCV